MTELDRWLDRPTRLELERRYWDPIEATGSLESLLDDPAFAADPGTHLSLFSDHSATHARDVALRVLMMLDEHNGTLIARRDGARLDFMKAYGVWLTYLHDVGMVEGTPEGRRMHAQYAAQLVYRDEFDDLIARAGEAGPVGDRVREVVGSDPAVVDLRLRELLAMSLCHSKSTVPTATLLDLSEVRRAMTVAICVDMAAQFAAKVDDGDWTVASLEDTSEHAERYATRDVDPFGWLVDTAPAERALVEDVLDTVRVLRVADSLRQRGRDLRTSAGFEVFVDDSGEAVFHVAAAGSDVAVHLRVDSPLSVGEANIEAATLEPQGDLRIVLHRGAFAPAARARVAAACARVIADIADDVLDVFPLAPARKVLIETHDDDRAIAHEVQAAAAVASAALGARTAVVPPLSNCSDDERERYLDADAVPWPSDRAERLLAAVAERGFRSDLVDAERCFQGVRLARVAACDVLIHEGEPATFVYVPAAPGLELRPGGGFSTQPLAAWRRLGATAVLRRGVRNSTVVATEDLDVFMIPGHVYAEEWFQPYGVADLDAIRHLLDRDASG